MAPPRPQRERHPRTGRVTSAIAVAIISLAISCCSTGAATLGARPHARGLRPGPSPRKDWRVTDRPARFGLFSLDALSCGAVASCVGIEADRFSNAALVVRGEALSTAPLVEVQGGLQVDDVSCVDERVCVAVASLASDTSDAAALPPAVVETFDGTSWALLPGPVDSDPSLELHALSCATETTCVAIGSDAHGSVVASYSSGEWSLTKFPSLSLSEISCPSASSCLIVGLTDTGALTSLVLSGGDWRTLTPVRRRHATLLSVSCSSPRFCLAVGYLDRAGRSSAFGERFDGRSWTEVAPIEMGHGEAVLNAVSCVAAGRCIAVGNTGPADAAGLGFRSKALVASYDGDKLLGHELLGSQSTLTTVSCRVDKGLVGCAAGGFRTGRDGRRAILARYRSS